MNPDLVISLYMNQSDNVKENGIEAYVSRENIYVKDSKLVPQGVKPANFHLLRK